jgi:hypothetical protein
LVRSKSAPSAAAELAWRGATRRVTDAGALAAEVKALAASVVGTP